MARGSTARRELLAEDNFFINLGTGMGESSSEIGLGAELNRRRSADISWMSEPDIQ